MNLTFFDPSIPKHDWFEPFEADFAVDASKHSSTIKQEKKKEEQPLKPKTPKKKRPDELSKSWHPQSPDNVFSCSNKKTPGKQKERMLSSTTTGKKLNDAQNVKLEMSCSNHAKRRQQDNKEMSCSNHTKRRQDLSKNKTTDRTKSKDNLSVSCHSTVNRSRSSFRGSSQAS